MQSLYLEDTLELKYHLIISNAVVHAKVAKNLLSQALRNKQNELQSIQEIYLQEKMNLFYFEFKRLHLKGQVFSIIPCNRGMSIVILEKEFFSNFTKLCALGSE